MRRFFNAFVGCAVSCCALTSAANADSVEMRRIDAGIGRPIILAGPVIGTPRQIFIGDFINEFRNGTGDGAGLNGTMSTFCTDLAQDASFDWQTFSVVALGQAPDPGPAMGPVKAQALADIIFGAGATAHQDADHAAAFQMLVWEILADYDGTPGSLNLNAGNAQFSQPIYGFFSDVVSIYDSYRAFIGINAPQSLVRAVTNPEFQDQIVLLSVPAPGAAALAGIGLLAGIRRPRRR